MLHKLKIELACKLIQYTPYKHCQKHINMQYLLEFRRKNMAVEMIEISKVHNFRQVTVCKNSIISDYAEITDV